MPELSESGLAGYWFPVCKASQLRPGQVLRREVLGTPLAVFRTEAGRVGALVDSCPHRRVPLTGGKVVGESIECNYHGRRFDCGGTCVAVPGRLPTSDLSTARGAESWDVTTSDGLVWVTASEASAVRRPYRLPHFGERAYTTGILECVIENRYDNCIDNYADCTHGPYVHTGLGYSAEQRHATRLDVHAYRAEHRDGPMFGVETSFENKALPPGLIGRVFLPEPGAVIRHDERYLVPTMYQVEYEVGRHIHFVTTLVCTPERNDRTRVFKVFSIRARLPRWLLHLPVRLLLRRIMIQDVDILDAQEQNSRKTGRRSFFHDEVDASPIAVRRLIRKVERGEDPANFTLEPQQHDIML